MALSYSVENDYHDQLSEFHHCQLRVTSGGGQWEGRFLWRMHYFALGHHHPGEKMPGKDPVWRMSGDASNVNSASDKERVKTVHKTDRSNSDLPGGEYDSSHWRRAMKRP
jgi:hypothetical protein